MKPSFLIGTAMFCASLGASMPLSVKPNTAVPLLDNTSGKPKYLNEALVKDSAAMGLTANVKRSDNVKADYHLQSDEGDALKLDERSRSLAPRGERKRPDGEDQTLKWLKMLTKAAKPADWTVFLPKAKPKKSGDERQ